MREITIFEHTTLRPGKASGITADELAALRRYYGELGVPYFSLTADGVRFCEYVGVLQVGDLSIFVVPKSDNGATEENKNAWRNRLIDMLRVVQGMDVRVSGAAPLKLRPNSILEHYITLFISEVEYLLRRGLIREYKRKTGNRMALKGRLHFSRHLSINLVHKERFYVQYSHYDHEHLLHQILYKALWLIHDLTLSGTVKDRLGSVLLQFPEMPDLKVTEATFANIVYGRKNDHYHSAVEYARLLLLNYHPDIAQGRNHVLALMFDMNRLWESFVASSLQSYCRKKRKRISVKFHHGKAFWKPAVGKKSSLVPDILIKLENKHFIIDAKWKVMTLKSAPSPHDLRQMYAYNEHFEADKAALVYPGNSTMREGQFYLPDAKSLAKECSLLFLKVENDVRKWQTTIGETIIDWLLGKSRKGLQ